jgi:hypothetical protein
MDFTALFKNSPLLWVALSEFAVTTVNSGVIL